MSEFTRPVEKLGESTIEYVNLKIEDIKLRTAKGLSISLNHLLSMILVLSTASVVLLALAFGLIILIGDALDNYAIGAFIIAGVFLIATVILFMLRKKLFINSFLKMFLNIFFDEEE